jgi:hypothetical protein
LSLGIGVGAGAGGVGGRVGGRVGIGVGVGHVDLRVTITITSVVTHFKDPSTNQRPEMSSTDEGAVDNLRDKSYHQFHNGSIIKMSHSRSQ